MQKPPTMLTELLKGFRGLVQADLSRFNFQDRRKLVRLKCHYAVEAKIAQQGFAATVLDMGSMGLRLSSYLPLEKGQIVQLFSPTALKLTEPAICDVVWTKPASEGGEILAGTLYSVDPDRKFTWADYLMDELGFTNTSVFSKRRFSGEERLSGQMWIGSGQPCDIKVLNLGVLGTLLELDNGRLGVGEQVMLQLGPLGELPPFPAPGKTVRAEVRGNMLHCAVEFDELSAPDVPILGEYMRRLFLGGT